MAAMLIPAIASAVQAGFGIYRGIRADQALRELQRQRMPEMMDAAGPLRQNIALAQRQYTQGLAPQTRDLALGTMASQMASQRRAALDMAGGQMSTALGRIGAFNTNQFGLNLGAQNQMARERGMQQLMSANAQYSGLQQMDLRQKISQRLAQEQAYGTAKQQAMQDVVGAVGGFGMAALNNAQFNKMMDMYGKGSSGGVQATTAPSSTPQRTPLSEQVGSLVNSAPVFSAPEQKPWAAFTDTYNPWYRIPYQSDYVSIPIPSSAPGETLSGTLGSLVPGASTFDMSTPYSGGYRSLPRPIVVPKNPYQY